MTRFAITLVAFAAALATGLASTAPRATVSVYASFASDGQTTARAVATAREDLSVLVDGKPVAVESVSPVHAPASILLLVDLTWTTTRGHHPGQAADIAHLTIDLPRTASAWYPMLFPGLVRGLEKAFLPLLAPADDLRVGSFAGQRLSFSRAATARPLDRLTAFKEVVNADVVPLADWYGPARIWDAVAAGVTQFSIDSPFKSIVLVTDGQSSGNRLGHAEAIRAAVAHGVVVHVVCQKSWWDPEVAPPGETFVKPLADETGGLFRLDDAFARDPWDKPARIFRDILDAIHNTYEIRLNVTDGAEGVHPLEVRTHVPNLQVHAPRWLRIGAPRPER